MYLNIKKSTIPRKICPTLLPIEEIKDRNETFRTCGFGLGKLAIFKKQRSKSNKGTTMQGESGEVYRGLRWRAPMNNKLRHQVLDYRFGRRCGRRRLGGHRLAKQRKDTYCDNRRSEIAKEDNGKMESKRGIFPCSVPSHTPAVAQHTHTVRHIPSH